VSERLGYSSIKPTMATHGHRGDGLDQEAKTERLFVPGHCVVTLAARKASRYYSINLNQSRRLNCKRSTSSSASGLQWAIGPRSVLRLAITFSTALTLLNIPPKSAQFDLMISANSPKVV
jgi:hypothetical protein